MKVVNRKNALLFECPAMGCGTVRVPLIGDPRWNWNGSVERPTITPSIRISWDFGEPPAQVHNCCHFNITDGMIQFHGDCTHELAGKIIPMPELAGDFIQYLTD